ncbi:MAG TPA: serine/threonine-protein kinase [Kofleriaceae bacterium]|nr:serine/threonine-protein kinase [Kofleriaceae bacterium]
MTAPAADDSLIGFVLADKYRILRPIGRGGMGVVYEAEHVQLGKRLAIKLMLDKYAENSEAIARFQREAHAASRIGNEHIIDVSDIGLTHDGRPFVVMELLNGRSLAQVIEMTGPMPPWRAIAIMRQVLRAVGAAHASGIIHRDLKPDNIYLIEQAGQHDFVKLLDFGISKVTDPSEQVAFTKLTTTGVVMGTPLYMPPEQAMGNPVEAAADIYACGVILYELLAGKPPFEGPNYAVLVAKVLTAEPPYLGSVRPGLPLALVNAVHRALEKEPSARFATAEQFAASLPGDRTPSQIELAGTLDSGFAVPRVLPTMNQPGRAKWPFIAGSVALVAGAAIAAVLLMNRGDHDRAAAAPIPAQTQPSHTAPPPAPAPATGILEVATTPKGATITIDDVDQGTTPLSVTLPPGTHRVKVALAGYTGIDYEAAVRSAERTSVVIPLAKAAAVATEPAHGRTKHGTSSTKIKTSSTPIGPAPAGSATVKTDPKPDPKDPKPDPEDRVTKPVVTTPGTKPNPY